jgi:hypothetical protein
MGLLRRIKTVIKRATVRRPEIVVSEPEIDAALEHLRRLPGSAATSLPASWGRKRFLDAVSSALTGSVKVGDCKAVAPGVWVLIMPFGVDLMRFDEHVARGRWQAWVLLRPVGTDPHRITNV